MTSIFKIVSSIQWQEAQITGIIPKCSADEDVGAIRVHQFSDLESVCNVFFKADEYPMALEFAPESYPEQLTWQDKTDEKVWREGLLKIDSLSADLVLGIYSFEYQSTKEGGVFKLHGEI